MGGERNESNPNAFPRGVHPFCQPDRFLARSRFRKGRPSRQAYDSLITTSILIEELNLTPDTKDGEYSHHDEHTSEQREGELGYYFHGRAFVGARGTKRQET